MNLLDFVLIISTYQKQYAFTVLPDFLLIYLPNGTQTVAMHSHFQVCELPCQVLDGGARRFASTR
jgi:hypothetical protein